jgi:hypothetical protein
MAIVVLLGVFLVVFSRHEKMSGKAPAAAAANRGAHPTTFESWREAMAVDICGTLQPNLGASAKQQGLFTQGDGVIQTQPQGPQDSGANATLGRFFTEYGQASLSATTLRLPGGRTVSNGQSCNGRPAVLQVESWASAGSSAGTLLTSNPQSLHLENGQLITLAFVPKGSTLPKPSAKVLATLQRQQAAGGSSNVTPPTTPITPSTTSTTQSPATTAPGGSTGGPTTTAGAAGSTTTSTIVNTP